jgi:hypothetical protein
MHLLIPTVAGRRAHVPSLASRRGMSALEITLVVTIAAVALMFGYAFRPHHDHSPFTLFGAAPGMSLAELRQIVTKEHGGTVTCRPDFDTYQYCVLKYVPDPGFVAAVVDPDGRVIVVHAVTVVGLDGLEAEMERAQGAWSRVAQGASVPPLVEIADTGATRWASSNHRWTAELHFSGYRDPDVATQAILVDRRGVGMLSSRSSKGAERAKNSGWIPPTASEAAAAFATNREERASKYGDMVTSLSVLRDKETAYWNAHQAYTDDASALEGMFVPGAANLEILSASDTSWTARATHPSFPGMSCVAYGGKVPAEDWPVTAHGKRITWVEGSACDSLPPAVTPSLARAQEARPTTGESGPTCGPE